MKNILLTFYLLFCAAISAQQGPAYSGDYVDYPITTNEEKIVVHLPKGSKILDNGKVFINGKTYTLETTEKAPYLEMYKPATIAADTLQPLQKDAITLSMYSTQDAIVRKGYKPVKNEEKLVDVYYEYRPTGDGEVIVLWYDKPKEGRGNITKTIQAAKVAGSSVLMLSLEGPIENNTEDFKALEQMLREILDNTTYTTAVATP
ncbi:MAG: hypothetical protein V4581_11365 [Bacteroidota bacterium]